MSTKAQPTAGAMRFRKTIDALCDGMDGWKLRAEKAEAINQELLEALEVFLEAKKAEYEQHLEFIRSKVKGDFTDADLDQWSVFWRDQIAKAERLLANARRQP